jgi:hypothetical protein
MAVLSGCATVTSGSTQIVTIETEKDVIDASCELTDEEGRKWFVPSTPGAAIVKKGDGPMSLVCEKDGYKITTQLIEETVSNGAYGNILMGAGGGIGILVDTVSGAAQHYPDRIIVWMEPLRFDSDEDKKAWFYAKENFYAELEE